MHTPFGAFPGWPDLAAVSSRPMPVTPQALSLPYGILQALNSAKLTLMQAANKLFAMPVLVSPTPQTCSDQLLLILRVLLEMSFSQQPPHRSSDPRSLRSQNPFSKLL